MKKVSELSKMLIIGSIIGVVICCLSLIGLFLGQPGWLIGAGVGTVLEVCNIVLLYKGSESATKTMRPVIFLATYFGRIVLFLAGVLFTVMGQYFFKWDFMINSIWGLMIAYTPMTIVVVVVMTRSGKNPVTIGMKDEEEK